MAMVTPVGVEVATFDATKSQVFSFNVSGGNQVVKNKLTIINESGVTVYTNTQTTYAMSQTVAGGTLSNGNKYRFSFVTYDIYNNESSPSEYIDFYCVAKPTVTINNIPESGIITKSSYTFQATYAQTQNEKIEGLRFVLYDLNNNELSSSDIYTSTDNPPIRFTHTFYGFEDDKEYKIMIQGTTIHGLSFSSTTYIFLVNYANPEEFVSFEVVNACTEGYNQIKSNLKHIEGVANFEPVEYIDDTKVDVLDITLRNKITFEHKELITEDFVMQIWFGVGILGRLFRISNEEGNIYFEGKFLREVPYHGNRTKDCVEIYGYVDGEQVFYKRSNYIEITNNTADLILYFKYNPTNSNYVLTLNEYNKVDNYIHWGTVGEYYGQLETNNDDLIETTHPSTQGYLLCASNANEIEYLQIQDTNVEFNRLTNIRYQDSDYTAAEDRPSVYGNMTGGYPFTKLEIYNGIYDGIYVTTDVSMALTTEMPRWDYYTCMRALFENNLLAGNTESFDMEHLLGFRVKSRVQGSFDWIMTYFAPYTSVDNLKFIINDYFAPSGVTMEYGVTPLYEGDIEGNYSIVAQYTQWQKLFVTDVNGDTLSLVGNVHLNQLISNGSFGTLVPLMSKYPIVINNSQNDFDSGTISGTVLSDDVNKSLTTENRREIVLKREKWDKMLKNGNAKLIKDWNGYIWLARVNSNPTYTPSQTMSNGYGDISFSFVEQGRWDNYQDLIKNGFSLVVNQINQ